MWFDAGRRPASNLSATNFEPASVMEFGFKWLVKHEQMTANFDRLPYR